MKYEINNERLAATLTAVNVEASVVGQAPLEVVFGDSARIDVGATANYIKSGTAEVEALVETAKEYKTQAAQSATSAVSSAITAKDWATKTDGAVEDGKYSAKYYADQAVISATTATNAKDSAVEANTAAQTAKTSAQSSYESADYQRQLAQQYATNAGQSAEAAAASATTAANMADKDLSNLTATGEAKFTAKQDVISDLSTIRSGAEAGATAVQPADLSAYALDNAVVHLAGEETITGKKTFVGGYGAVVLKEESNATYIDLEFDNASGSHIGTIRAMDNGYLDLSVGFTKVYAQASSDNTSVVTTVNKSKAANGYFKLGNGLIIQWFSGQVASSNSYVDVTLPTPFSNTNYKVVGNKIGSATNGVISVDSTNNTTTSCRVYLNNAAGWFYCIAVGY